MNEITLTIGTTEQVEPEYLVDVIMWGLELHSAAVGQLGDAEVASDYYIIPTHIEIVK